MPRLLKTCFLPLAAALAACLSLAPPAVADSFGSGANAFTIEFVSIGHPGNPPDTTGQPNPAGSVPYAFRIGKYEISRSMIEKANAEGALGITLADMTLFGGNGPNKPATGVSWFEAARFVNWLNESTGNAPAYKFVPVDRFSPPEIVASQGFVLWQPTDPGYNPDNLFRNTLAKYFLPSADEWYKAAFYDHVAGVYWDYATGSNFPPIAIASGTAPGTAVYQQMLAAGPADVLQAGGLSPNGTMGQNGNAHEWQETALDLINDDVLEARSLRGGMWEFSALAAQFSFGTDPSNANFSLGFRVASIVPEPSAPVLIATALLGAMGMLRKHC